MVAFLAPVLVAVGCTVPAPRGTTAFVAPCADVLLVGARGSGSGLRSDEVRAWDRALVADLPGRRVATVELGDLDRDGVLDPGGYPAVPADAAPGLDPTADGTAGDLGVAGGFNDSRRIGTEELVRLLGARQAVCPGERLVLAGYSMGATAVGVALRTLAAGVAGRVDAVVLFGDPTLVPGPWLRAPGAEFPSGHGLVGARVPYVPDPFVDRTTSWCGLADPYCTGNLAWFLVKLAPCAALPQEPACSHRHEDYPRWAVPEAMQGAAAAVLARH